MKKMMPILGLMICISTTLNAVDGNLTENQVDAVQKLIKVYGYKCDIVNFAMRSNWDGSIRTTCNDNRYVYEVKDVGGTWTVKVK